MAVNSLVDRMHFGSDIQLGINGQPGESQHRTARSIVLWIGCLFVTAGCQPDDAKRTEPIAAVEIDARGDRNLDPQGSQNSEMPLAVGGAAFGGAAASEDVTNRESEDLGESVAAASELINSGRLDEASTVLTRLLVIRPHDVQVLFLSARLAAQQGDLSRAVGLLGDIPEDHPEAGLPALGQAAEWCFLLKRYEAAETNYRKLLNASPGFVPAIRQLAFLLNRQGRRQEASVLIRQLCELGDVLQDELHSLVALRDAMYHDPNKGSSQSTESAARYYFPIGSYGEARKAFQENDFALVMELLRPSIEALIAPAAIVALFGRAACEQQDDRAVAWWGSLPINGQNQFADYWATLGTLALQEQRYDSAVRALAEALKRDGTDLESMSRMRQALGSLGKEAEAGLWFDRWTEMRAVLDANNLVAATEVPDSSAVEKLATGLEQLDRKLEALMWRALSTSSESSGQSLTDLNEQHQQLVRTQQGFPELKSLWCGLDFNTYPLPEMLMESRSASAAIKSAEVVGDSKVVSPVFQNVARLIGLAHTYRVASQPLDRRYSIHQTLGGGIAVLDFDLDGWPDLYFSQGGSGPPNFVGAKANQLYRNQAEELVDVSDACSAAVHQYSIGVAKGDWNQDGFPDLAIANIGACLLLTNNGDGTFSRQSLEMQPNFKRVPASICIADVTGDGMPDVIQVGYVDDSNILAKPPLDEQGNVSITVSPGNFGGAVDCLFENRGDGRFSQHGLTDLADARTGLGIVVADFDGEPGNELLIGNDSLPNRLWKLVETGQNELKKVDLASVLGCAYGFSGGATGAMGIAVGDFDQDAKMDLHVTNYENENSNLYLRRGKAFKDRNRQFGLDQISRDLVGFGTQPIDYDNDRDTDLVVANGHLDNAVSIRGNFAQPVQLLCNQGRRFQLLDVSDQTAYLGTPHVGRSLAILDFDRDGLTDVVMTNIEEPSALLLNRTDTSNHWLRLELVGITSDRDAVGAEVILRGPRQTQHAWNVAGDGYLCSNEGVVSFGLGGDEAVYHLTVLWPDGTQQSFADVAADQRILVIQGQASVYQQ